MNSLPFLIHVADRAPVWAPGELKAALWALVTGSAVAVAVFRLVPRVPWPKPLTWRFVILHALAAPAAAALWMALRFTLTPTMDGIASDTRVVQRVQEMMAIGCFFYVVIGGLSYSANGAARAARAEAVAAQTQLAALRSQLQPHFLFNALHTVVQLIHLDPPRAAEAAELVADLLRRAVEEQRDELPLRDEWGFVSRYLAIEQLRFGERLVVNADLALDAQSERVPSFALQTLVENAVQHGAARRAAKTEIAITGKQIGSALVIVVRNGGDANASQTRGLGAGTGLARLRERLAVLYGGEATLVSGPMSTGGYEAVLTVPRNRRSDT